MASTLSASSTPHRGRKLERTIIPTPQRRQKRESIFLSVSPRKIEKASQKRPTKERGRSAFPSLSVEDVPAANRKDPSPLARFSQDTTRLLSSSPAGSIMSGISKEATLELAAKNIYFEMEVEEMETSSATTKELQESLVGTQNLVTNFSLLRGNKMRIPKPEEFEVLKRLFPQTFGVSADAPFLIIRVHELPPAPWPVTIAGVPLFITTLRTDRGCNHGQMGRGVELLTDVGLEEDIGEDLKDIMIAFIDHVKTNGIKIHRIAYLSNFFDVILYEEFDLRLLPLSLAGVRCEYRVKDAQKAVQYAWRGKEPGPGIDDTCYLPNLRPGVFLNSGVHINNNIPSASTTSGVAVKRTSDGQKFITVSSHGFNGVNSDVMHSLSAPGMEVQRIGTIAAEFEGTDISLVSLNPGIPYVNETFETNSAPATTITEMTNPFLLPHFSKISMNNPFSGACQGIFVAVDLMDIAEEGLDPTPGKNYDSSEPTLPWVSNTWAYFGNGGNDPQEGSCGTAMITEDGKLLSFYRYHDPSTNMSISMGADHIRDFGYELEDI